MYVRSMAVLALLIVLTGCEKRVTTIRIAVSPWIGYDLLYVAHNRGFFKAEGIDLELVEFETLTDSRRAYEQGEVDGWCASGVEYILSLEKERRSSTVVLAFDYSSGADVIVARESIGSVRGLLGKRVAFEPGTLDALMLNLALEEAGMSMEDVIPVPLPQSNIADALQKGAIDAAVTFPPQLFKIESGKGVIRLYDSAKIPGLIIDLLAFDPMLARDSTLVRGFVSAYYKALALERQQGPGIYSGLVHYAGVSQKSIADSLRGMHRFAQKEAFTYLSPAGEFHKDMEKIAAAMYRAGIVKEAYHLKLPPIEPAIKDKSEPEY